MRTKPRRPTPRRTEGDPVVAALLHRLTPAQLRVLARVAKHPTRGAYPLFKHPRAMIALREAQGKD
jgi:hypothetical protein